MLASAHHLLLVLIAFALVGGTAAQLAWSGEPATPTTMAGMPCDMMMSAVGSDHGKPTIPCKGMTPDCIKQMGCVIATALPVRLANGELAAHFSAVDYWSAWFKLAGLVRAPEPLPPRTT
jgi:hypothetical protein